MRTKRYRVKEFIETLKQSSELLIDFDGKLWYALWKRIAINVGISMKFKNDLIML